MSEAEDRSVNVTDGDLVKPMLVLSGPIILSMLLQVGYNLADTFWVGRLGEDAVTALGLAWPLVFLTISFAGGFTVAGTVLVAQHKGAGNDARIDHVAGQTIAFVSVLAVAFSAVGYLLVPQLLGLVGATPGSEVHRLAVDYTRTIFLGVVFMFGFFIFQALLRGWGDTKTPLYLMAFGVAINVVLDPLLILGFQDNVLFGALGLRGLEATLLDLTGFTGMGVQGAAAATVISRALGATLGFAWLFSGAVGIHLSLDDLILRRETVERIVRIGAPASVEQSTRALGITVLTALVAVVGADAAMGKDAVVGGFTIANRITSLVFLPALGFARGTETVVGQNLGSDQADRAKRAVRAGVLIIAVVLVGVSVVAMTFADSIVGVFISGEGAADVTAIGVDYLVVVGPTFAFLGAFQILQGGFRGSGSTTLAMGFGIASLWVFRIPAAYYFSQLAGMGPTGVWWGIAFSNVASVVVAAVWFLRGTWTENVVEEEHATPAD
ncbi:MATE family efflux transporter [Halomarina rubra]|uniref:MATE family efflux transporter n=1 Tax=Halomarina rubra TaxID=2071873 RepID=A0ABD6B0H8_9EURY|nr:MATE family efflux transporter [Halomarina rubra]